MGPCQCGYYQGATAGAVSARQRNWLVCFAVVVGAGAHKAAETADLKKKDWLSPYLPAGITVRKCTEIAVFGQ